MKPSKRSAEVLDNQSNDGWLQITPGERFRIRASVKETKGIYTMLELIADPRNGVPMQIHQNEDEHFIILEGCTSPTATKDLTPPPVQRSRSTRALPMPGAICKTFHFEC